MDWNNARIVLAIHKGGSLTAAGRLLDLDQSTVGRRLAAYEEELHARLFDRRENRLIATREGQVVADHAARMEAEAYALETHVRGLDDVAEGEVVITAVHAMSSLILMPALDKLRARGRRIRPRFLNSDLNISLERQEADIAVRTGRPTSGRAIARKIGTMGYKLFAHRDLIARAGTDDPARLPWIGYSEISDRFPEVAWVKQHYPGVDVIASVNSAASRAHAIVAGIGVGVVPAFYIERMPGVVALAKGAVVAEREIWTMMLPEYRGVARFQIAMEWIVETIEDAAKVLAGEALPSGPVGPPLA